MFFSSAANISLAPSGPVIPNLKVDDARSLATWNEKKGQHFLSLLTQLAIFFYRSGDS
jgi:hypothetical protein